MIDTWRAAIPPAPPAGRAWRSARGSLAMILGCSGVGLGLALSNGDRRLTGVMVGILSLAIVLLAPRPAAVTAHRPPEARLASLLASMALVLLVASDYHYFQATGPGGANYGIDGIIHLIAFASIGMFVVLQLSGLALQRRSLEPSERSAAPIRLLTMYALYMTVSAAYAPDRLFSLISGLHLLCAVLLGLLVVRTRTAGMGIEHFGRRFVYLTVGSAVFDFIMPDKGYDRFSWANLGPVAAGTFAAISVVVVAARLLNPPAQPRPGRMTDRLLLAACAVIAVGTIARSASIACLAACAVLLALNVRGMRRLWRITAILCGAALLAYVVLPLIFDFVSRGQSQADLASLTGRTEHWRLNWHLIRAHPIFGYGFLSTRSIFNVPGGASHLLSSHNALLEVLTSGGVVGASLLLLTVFATFSRLRKRQGAPRSVERSRYLVSVGVLAFLMVNGITSSSFASGIGNQFIWFVMVVSYASTPSVEAPTGPISEGR